MPRSAVKYIKYRFNKEVRPSVCLNSKIIERDRTEQYLTDRIYFVRTRFALLCCNKARLIVNDVHLELE